MTAMTALGNPHMAMVEYWIIFIFTRLCHGLT